MIIVLGLAIFVAALVVAVAGVLSNGGHGHALLHGFAVFGYHVTGSTGALFLYGVVVGAVAVFGLSLLLTGARRTSRRGRIARGELKQSRLVAAAVSEDRDRLVGQRDSARAESSAARRPAADHRPLSGGVGRRHHLFGRRSRELEVRAEPQPDGQSVSPGVEAISGPAVSSGEPPRVRT